MNEFVLKDLEKKVQENRLRNLAINIVKYQNFKTNAILNKIDWAGYSKSAIATYINCGISYIRKKIRKKNTVNLYNYIDEAKANCITPLVPKENEKREEKKQKQKIIPVQKVLQHINDKAIEDKKYQIAVQVDDSIKLQDDLKHAEGFLDGLRFCGRTNVKIVRVRIEEVNE